MTDYKALLTGYPIHIATKEIQRRKHHKKRINKKWLKRYGTYEINMMPHNKVVMMDGAIWMTKRTYEVLKKQVLDKNCADELKIQSAIDSRK